MKFLREPIILLLLTAGLTSLVYLGQQAPRALPEGAPQDQFSAGRALSLLRDLLPGQKPHPAGTDAHSDFRQGIIRSLEDRAYSVEVQSLDHCNPDFGACSPVHNILARLPGDGGGEALLLTAHYDSVDAGPGIGDDASGVAALLELADLARRKGGFRHDIIFLFSDAEELGLIGAHAFATRHSWFPQVAAVINIEARGVSGASSMFETGKGNRSFIRILAKSLDRPVANSISREVYRRMPNDTDFSVYRERELDGFNFAFTGGGAVYHSAIDNLEQLDPDSLQHHGQNAWALLQALDQREVSRIGAEEDAAYIDLFGQSLLHYPVSSASGLALVLGVLLLVFIRMAFPRQLRIQQVAWSWVLILLMAGLLLGTGWLLSWPLGHWVDANRMGHPYPWPGRIALFLAAVLAVRLVFNALRQRATTGSTTLACWLIFAGLAMLLSIQLPAASFIGVLPLVAFVLGSMVDLYRWKKHPQLITARMVGFVAAAYLGLYFFFVLEVVVSFHQAWVQLVPLLLPLIAVLPLLVSDQDDRPYSKQGLVVLLLPLVIICIGQQFLPGHTVDRPRGMNLVYKMGAGLDQPLWLLENSSSAPDEHYVERHAFRKQAIKLAGRSQNEVLVVAAEPLEFGAVELLELAALPKGEEWHTEVRLELPAGLRQLVVWMPAGQDIQSLKVNGLLALQAAESGSGTPGAIVLNRPRPGVLLIQWNGRSNGDLTKMEVPVRARFALPEVHSADMMQGWPLDAQPQHYGHRAEVEYLFKNDK